MTKGKYAIRAANRLAQLDSEIVLKLREKLTSVTEERDAAQREVKELQRSIASEANRIAEATAGQRLAHLESQLHAEQNARREDRAEYARRVVEVIRRFGGKLPMSGYAALSEIFGQSANAGQMAFPTAPDRRSRRANASTLRLGAEIRNAPSWLQAPVSPTKRKPAE